MDPSQLDLPLPSESLNSADGIAALQDHREALRNLLVWKDAIFAHNMLPAVLLAQLTLLVSQLWRSGQLLCSVLPVDLSRLEQEETKRAQLHATFRLAYEEKERERLAAIAAAEEAKNEAVARVETLRMQLGAQRWRSLCARSALAEERVRSQKMIEKLEVHNARLNEIVRNRGEGGGYTRRCSVEYRERANSIKRRAREILAVKEERTENHRSISPCGAEPHGRRGLEGTSPARASGETIGSQITPN
ncbi:MAG: hypothetical protein SGPRY_010304 [Prymnesium sp.]